MSPSRPPLAFRLLAPFFSGIVTLLLLEGLLAWFWPTPFAIERNMYYEPDPYTGFRLKPYGIGYFQNGIPAVANRHGHRDEEVSLEKPSGVFRILVLGDSFTVGANVRQEEAYPQVLERLLNAEARGRRYEVVNTAVGGWEPFQYAQYYEYYGRRFTPDLVLVGFFVGNDAYNQLDRVEELPTAVLGRRVSRRAAAHPLTPVRVWLLEHSHLARRLFQQATPHALVFTRTRCDAFSEEYLAVQRERLSNHLRRDAEREALVANSIAQIERIQRLTAAEGIPLLLVLLPDENQLNPALQARLIPAAERERYDFTMPQALLRERFAALGLPTLDLLPVFQQDPRCLYMNDTHWTPEGHLLAAQAIAAWLRPYLPE